MDSGLAVVIGAVVAFVGSIVGTVFAPRWIARNERQERERRERRERIRIELVLLTEALGAVLLARRRGEPWDSTPAMLATSRIALDLHADQSDVELLAVNTMRIVAGESIGTAATGLSVFQTIAHRWFRGEIAAGDIMAAAEDEFARVEEGSSNE